MSIKTIILGLTAVASVALPGVASAQSYGGGYGNGGYYGQRYDDRGGYRNDERDYRFDDRRDRHRWEERRRWEERERRRAWERAHRFHDRYDGYDRGY
ncbi:hypothetical protein [Sphingomonas sp.]|uniref:hypothetical protein n=1 Tax=Sphingomonas sp. TaxID=28214 RepID=UPI003CC691ED